jgi:hypothetical protein
MEAPRKTFNRLVGALDELVTREAATLAEHDYAGVSAIQQRAEPLVEALAAMGSFVDDAVARARVAGLLARRQHSIDFLETQLATARAELMAVQNSALRVAQIAPVYGRPRTASGPSKFHAAG